MTVLAVKDLQIDFEYNNRVVSAVRNVSFDVARGESIALVGASGSGKTVLGRSLLGLVDKPGVVRGSALFDGTEMVGASEKAFRAVRGRGIAMVFQDALDGLNPVFSIGSQLMEIFTIRLGFSKADARGAAVRAMERVGIPRAAERFYDYPHQFSGGMRQRICIAMAIALDPKLLIADEPTTALDVTVQAEILRLIRDLQQQSGMSLIFVTHDLAVARMISERTMVMFAGRIVETGNTERIFTSPKHPYTCALLAAHPARARSWRDLVPLPDDFVTDIATTAVEESTEAEQSVT
jgi:peptide/nickel transport system ATP-binding protein/oligopeptide transport system ATP-binding protein